MSKRALVVLMLLAGLFGTAVTTGSETARSLLAIAGLLIALPLAIVKFIDLVEVLNADPHAGRGRRLVAMVASLPVVLLGLTSIAIGLSLIAWVVYNLAIDMQPEFRGWTVFQPLGIAPALIALGWCWLTIGRRERRVTGQRPVTRRGTRRSSDPAPPSPAS